jgi:hypothetical protein
LIILSIDNTNYGSNNNADVNGGIIGIINATICLGCSSCVPLKFYRPLVFFGCHLRIWYAYLCYWTIVYCYDTSIPHTAWYVSYICPHTACYTSYIRPHTACYVSYIHPHTAWFISYIRSDTEQVISHITCLTSLVPKKISQTDKILQILNRF